MAEKKVAKKTATRKRKITTSIDKGRVYVQSSFNNTIVTVTDAAGNALASCSAGALGYKGSKKSTAKLAKDYGLKSVEVYVKGPGNGRESAVRSLAAADLEVTMIRDISPIPHNGCRPPKPRRI